MRKQIHMEYLFDESRSKVLSGVLGISLFFCLAVLFSQIRIPLPYTPVPFTLQVLAVFLTGYFLTPRSAAATMILYIMAGLSGLPVFSGAAGGAYSLAGPTGGYIIGFIPAAWMVSYLSGKKFFNRFNSLVTVACGLGIIYAFGLVHLLVYSKFATGLTGMELLSFSVKIGILPFLLIDSVKGILAAVLFYGLMGGKKLVQ